MGSTARFLSSVGTVDAKRGLGDGVGLGFHPVWGNL
jgi:hypothetical protein